MVFKRQDCIEKLLAYKHNHLVNVVIGADDALILIY